MTRIELDKINERFGYDRIVKINFHRKPYAMVSYDDFILAFLNKKELNHYLKTGEFDRINQIISFL
jgi:hypothetical protein